MSQYTLAEIKAKLESLGAAPKKSLGQNFLVNKASIEKIIQVVRDLSPKALVEVGPGLGALTEGLLSMSLPVCVIELDRAFSELWRQAGVKVIEADALQINWKEMCEKQELGAQVCLVSNLPYQISASLVIDRSVEPSGVESMVLMFQKEVAQRMVAKPKTDDYGMLSVIAQVFWQVDFVLEVSSKDFYPPPQVASRVLRFKYRDELPKCLQDDDKKKKFLQFVKAAFAQRRKLMLKNLMAVVSGEKIKLIEQWLQGRNQLQARAEEMTPKDFVEMYRLVNES